MSYKDISSGNLISEIKDRYLGKMVTDSRSPAGSWLQFTLEYFEKGHVIVSSIVKSEMTNPYGNIHGGMMSAVIDEAIGWAVVSLEAENHYTSLNLNVDFLYAIKEGDRLKAEAKIIRHGKKILYAECSVYNMADYTLLARGTSNLVVTNMKIKE